MYLSLSPVHLGYRLSCVKTLGASQDDSSSLFPLPWLVRDSMAMDPRLIPAPMTHLVPDSADLLARALASQASTAS